MKTFKDTLDAKFMVEAALPTRTKHLKYIAFLRIRNVSIDQQVLHVGRYQKISGCMI